MAIKLLVSGMYCDRCVDHVREALLAAGATEAEVSLAEGRAEVEGPLDLEKARELLATSRYRLHPLGSDGSGAEDPEWGRREFNLIVLGSGSAAFAAAIRARDNGFSVALVERDVVGGTCVNIGCVPSKALLAASRRHPQPTLAEAVAQKDELVSLLRQAKYLDLLDHYGIQLIEGEGRIVDGHTVSVGDRLLSADVILIATGAEPAIPPIEGLNQVDYLTSTTALELREPPRRLAVIGANAVGLELGQLFGNFGSQVTFIELDRLAPYEEPELASRLKGVLQGEGHQVLERASVREARAVGGEVVLRGEGPEGSFELATDAVLVATGRRPRTAGLGLEEAGVITDERGTVVVDPHQRTSVPSIYAAGDVANQPQFVYVAAAAGAIAAENGLLHTSQSLDLATLPRVTFTNPQLAGAGLTEQAAKARGLAVRATVLGLDAVPRALVEGRTEGAVKLVCESGSGRLLGGSLLAEGAGEVAQALVYALRSGMTVEQIAASWSPYLTIAEAVKLAAQSFSRDVAALSCCAA